MDWELVCKLLDVVDGAHGHPKLKALEDEATATLLDMAAKAQEILDKRRQDAKVAAQEEAAKVAAVKDKEIKAEEAVAKLPSAPPSPPSSYPYTDNGRRA